MSLQNIGQDYLRRGDENFVMNGTNEKDGICCFYFYALHEASRSGNIVTITTIIKWRKKSNIVSSIGRRTEITGGVRQEFCMLPTSAVYIL